MKSSGFDWLIGVLVGAAVVMLLLKFAFHVI